MPEFLHRILNLLAATRARLRLPSFVPFARLFHAVLNRLRFGEHRGGMYVRAVGRAEGAPASRSWHLLAEGDDGPLIPSMAIEAIVRKLLAGVRPEPGARSGVRALELSDYEPLFARRRIHAGFRPDDAEDVAAPLYRRILGSAYDALPPTVRALHDSTAPRRWSGLADVRRGRGRAAGLVAALFGFPAAARQIPVSVSFTPRAGGAELWTRSFAGRSFSSLQAPGTGRNSYLLVERFGLASFALALVVEGDRLRLVPRRWSLAGLPMPRRLLPRGESFETEEDGRFLFDVEIALPLIGRVVAYRGVLDPDDSRPGRP